MESMERIVSVAEMSRMVGLSRARFYQLVGSTFPFPIYDVATHRPFFNEELQQVCMDVRRRNVGINGKPIFFHSRGGNALVPKRKAKTTKPNQYVDLIDGFAGTWTDGDGGSSGCSNAIPIPEWCGGNG